MKPKLFTSLKKKVMKRYLSLSTAIFTFAFYAMSSFAAGFNTGGLLTGVKSGLIAVVSITGGGIAVFGVIHLIEANTSSDPNAKTAAIKQLAGGLGLIIVGAIVIPIFTDAITF